MRIVVVAVLAATACLAVAARAQDLPSLRLVAPRNGAEWVTGTGTTSDGGASFTVDAAAGDRIAILFDDSTGGGEVDQRGVMNWRQWYPATETSPGRFRLTRSRGKLQAHEVARWYWQAVRMLADCVPEDMEDINDCFYDPTPVRTYRILPHPRPKANPAAERAAFRTARRLAARLARQIARNRHLSRSRALACQRAFGQRIICGIAVWNPGVGAASCRGSVLIEFLSRKRARLSLIALRCS